MEKIRVKIPVETAEGISLELEVTGEKIKDVQLIIIEDGKEEIYKPPIIGELNK